MTNSKSFRVGQTVAWKSASQGTTKRKEGRVVAVVPPRGSFLDVEQKLAGKLSFASAFGGGSPRPEASYAVLVPAEGKRQPTLYWPRTSALSLVK